MRAIRISLAAMALAMVLSATGQSLYQSALRVKPRKGVTVTGTVECDGRPLKGVKVSDGYLMTQTDRDGCYYLKSQKRNPQVFISVPSGYEAYRDDVVPQYWADLTCGPDTLERHDFRLVKADTDRHALILVTDLHLANQRNDVATFTGPYMERLRHEVDSLQGLGYRVMTFHLGDGTWDSYWYVNDFPISRLRDTFNKAGYPTALYNIMGNHDNNGGEPWSADTDMDFEAARPFMKAFGPRYFSFDAGNAHYVFLDNIVYKNEPTDKEKMPGITGRRNFTEAITPEQFAWLRSDLAGVDTDSPVIIAMHSPLVHYKGLTDEIKPMLAQASVDTLLKILDPFNQIHIISGHTHRQALTRLPDHGIVDHNIASASGSTWWTSGLGAKNLCMDGSPAGYEVMTIDGNDVRWRHETWDFEPGRQFLAFDINSVKEYFRNNGEYQAFVKLYPAASNFEEIADNAVYIDVFAWDPQGTLKVTENGRELPVEMIMAENPNYAATAMLQRSLWINSYPKKVKRQKKRMFKVEATSANTDLEIIWTDPFGVEYRETLRRPHPFGFPKADR